MYFNDDEFINLPAEDLKLWLFFYTYGNNNTKFRHINWACDVIAQAKYDDIDGLYWGDWGPFKQNAGFWRNAGAVLFFIVLGFFIYKRGKRKMHAENSQQ